MITQFNISVDLVSGNSLLFQSKLQAKIYFCRQPIFVNHMLWKKTQVAKITDANSPGK